jgi:hypothetical protein
MKLIKIGKNRYRFEFDGVSLEGNLGFISEQMREQYQIPKGELEKALLDMLEFEHDAAYFGVLGGRLMYTAKEAQAKLLRAELRAIQELREEIVEIYRRDGYRTPEVLEKLDRLEKLYLSLNITGLIQVLDRVEDNTLQAA